MPIYEYTCTDCGHTTEALRKISQSSDAITCEKCDSKNTSRIHSLFSAQVASPAPGCDAAQMGSCGCAGNLGACPMA